LTNVDIADLEWPWSLGQTDLFPFEVHTAQITNYR